MFAMGTLVRNTHNGNIFVIHSVQETPHVTLYDMGNGITFEEDELELLKE